MLSVQKLQNWKKHSSRSQSLSVAKGYKTVILDSSEHIFKIAVPIEDGLYILLLRTPDILKEKALLL